MVYGHLVNNVMMQIMIQGMDVIIFKSLIIIVAQISLINLLFVINAQIIV